MSGRPGRVKASYPIRMPRPLGVIKAKDSASRRYLKSGSQPSRARAFAVDTAPPSSTTL